MKSGRPRILVADDDPANREILVRLLSRLGAEVLAAADGEAALGLARERPLDLAFVDILMPRLDGLGFARVRRSQEAEAGLRRLFLVALTGGEKVDEALSAGFDLFLQKPAGLAALREALREAARRSGG
jgi:two-component system, sensor histidine kinase RpfC